MSKGKMLSREAVLKLAGERPFVVHRFSWGESAIRTLTMRMFSQGLLRVEHQDKERIYYRTVENKA
jgi:DNA-binding transcriptional regulator PaaX